MKMRYWYYSWKSTKSGVSAEEGCNICQTDNLPFDLVGESRFLWAKQGTPCIIIFWKEITKHQWESYTKFLLHVNGADQPGIRRVK